ncbi:hypothetical protein LTS18_009093 [Coniosporium uncinatum]|uniref:Uncharacterized protein n=1 Tax=Coniosporium uncinatum TaxID=93489 RepID=A0ACC3DWM3_9PEZI|nr:hypothetical protein LTS18_009093 [Coniosporium uncinatum]
MFSVHYSITLSRDDDFTPKQHSNAGRKITVPEPPSDEEDSDRGSSEYGSDDDSRSSVVEIDIKPNKEEKIISNGKVSEVRRFQTLRTNKITDPSGSHSNPLDAEAEHIKKHTIVIEEDADEDEGPESEPIVKMTSTTTVLVTNEGVQLAEHLADVDVAAGAYTSAAYDRDGGLSDGEIQESAMYDDDNDIDEDSVVGAEFDSDISDADAHSERLSSPEVTSDEENEDGPEQGAVFSERPTQPASPQPDTVRKMKLDDILQDASCAQPNSAERVSAVPGHVDKHSEATPCAGFTHGSPQTCVERQYSGLSDLKRDNILHEQDPFALGGDNWDDSFLDSAPPSNVYSEGPFAMPKVQFGCQNNRPLGLLPQNSSFYPSSYEAYQWPAVGQVCATSTSLYPPRGWVNPARRIASVADHMTYSASTLQPSVLSSDAKINSKIAIADILDTQDPTSAASTTSTAPLMGTKRKADDMLDGIEQGNTTEWESFAGPAAHLAAIMDVAKDAKTTASAPTAVEPRPTKKQKIVKALPHKRSKLRSAATAMGYLVAGSIGGIVALAALPESLFQ